ncbi:hypothetical protein [Lysobacter sp. A378]
MDFLIMIDLSKLLVPIIECLQIPLGAISREIIEDAESKGYDDLPVIGEDGLVMGFIPVARARQISDGKTLLSSDDREMKFSWCPIKDALDDFLARLSDHRIIGIQGDGGVIVGIVTISDLNRHSFRALLYPLLAELEELLARVIDAEFHDPWVWLDKLGDSKSSVVGHWECLKREGLDVGATAGTTLAQLLTVFQETLPLRERLFSSKSQLKQFKGRALKYRNSIMHPARPLVSSQTEVSSLRCFVHQLRVITRVAGELSRTDIP